MLGKFQHLLIALISIGGIEVMEIINTINTYEIIFVRTLEIIIALSAVYKIFKGKKVSSH